MKYLKKYDEVINEGRVKRSERLEVLRNDDIIVVMPLTHTALRKYGHKCQWCINDDPHEWTDYHKGRHVVIIQRKPKGQKKGVTGKPTAEEIFVLDRWDSGNWDLDSVEQTLNYQFRNETSMERYLLSLTADISNFATDVVYYAPEGGSVYDMEDNLLANFNLDVLDLPNVTPDIKEIIDDFVSQHGSEYVGESTTHGATHQAIDEIRERSVEVTDTGALVAVIDWDNATHDSLERDLKGFNLELNQVNSMIRRYSINKGEGLIMLGINWGEIEGLEQTVHDFMVTCGQIGKVKGPWGPLMYCMEDPNQEGARLSNREGTTGKYTQDFVFIDPNAAPTYEAISFGSPSPELKELKQDLRMRAYELSDLGGIVKILDVEDEEPICPGAVSTKKLFDRLDQDYDTLVVSTDFTHAEGDWLNELSDFLDICEQEGQIVGPRGPLTYFMESDKKESYRERLMRSHIYVFVKPRKYKREI